MKEVLFVPPFFLSLYKINVMAKKKTANKEQKPTETKRPTPKQIDWNELGSEVVIVGVSEKHLIPGKEYKVSKEMAQILVEKKAAKLK